MPGGAQPEESMKSNYLQWETRPQSFKFTIADHLVAHFKFEAEVLEAPLTWYLCGNRDAAAVPQMFENAKTYVVRSSPISGSSPRFSLTETHIRYIPRQYDRCFIEFRGSFQDYLARHSAKARKNLGRQVRKLAAAANGDLMLREYQSPTEMRRFHALATELSLTTYQHRLFNEGFATYATSEEMLARSDDGRGYILFLAEKPIAYVYAICFPEILLYQIVGYDAAYKEYSPGTVLLYLLIEKLFNESLFRYMDFGEGHSWYKEFFSTGSSRCARVYYFPKKPKNFAAVSLHMAWNSVTNMAGWGLERLGLRAKLRTLLRSHSVEQSTGAKAQCKNGTPA
jgi:Acetyltransferase (GNAT) domain